MDRLGGRIVKPCPFDSANFLSKLLFLWMIPTFRHGYSHDLDLPDLHLVPTNDAPQVVADRLERAWTNEVNSKTKPSLLLAIFKAFGLRYLIVAQIIFVAECILRTCQPLLVGVVVRYFSQRSLEGEHISSSDAYCAAFGICATSIVIAYARHHYFGLVQRIGMNVRSSLTVLIYKKLLKLSSSSFEQTSVGHILNVLANDLNRFDEVSHVLYYFVVAPIQAIVVLCMLWHYLEYACLGGMAILVLYVPFQAFMGRLFRMFRRKATAFTDDRVKLMSEIITAMKLIKVYCWERPFADLVDVVRKDEIRTMKWSSSLKAINTAIYFVATRIMLFASFIVFVLLGGQLDAETVFVTMSLFNALRTPVTYELPIAIGSGAETLIALSRCQKLMLLQEKNERLPRSALKHGHVQLRRYSAKWTKNQPEAALTNITFDILPSTLAIVIGSVGAGKSCLLNGLLNELEDVSGTCHVTGSTSYCPQESWCFSATIRANILLGSVFEETRYNQVIDACGLQRDLELLPDGDRTYVGERGYTLSGGQKARITLARAVYKVADVYLLDDPLSAVDPIVANHIFENCIKQFLRYKTVVLVTHQLQFLNQSDKILLFEHGQLKTSGKFDELVKSGLDFLSILDNASDTAESELKKERSKSRTKSANSNKKALEQLKLTEVTLEQNAKNEREKRQEVSSSGSVKWSVYWKYIRSGTSIPFFTFAVSISIISQLLFHYTDFFLSNWTRGYEPKNVMNTSLYSNSNTTDYVPDVSPNVTDETWRVTWYSILIICLFVSAFLRTTAVFLICLNCSIKLHNIIFRTLLRAPLKFFENNPLGRILNRFTRDVGQIDQSIPPTLNDLITSLLNTVGILAVGAIVNPIMLIPAFVLVAISYPFRRIYVLTSRDIKRLDSTSLSPIYSHITATFDSLTTIRAFGLETQFFDQYMLYLNDATACRFMTIYSQRAIGFTLDTFALMYLCSVAVLLVSFPEGIPGGNAGLVLSSVLILTGMFQACVRQTAELENQMVSVERVLEYGELKSEAALIGKKIIDKNWPVNGAIKYEQLDLKYDENGKNVLSNLSFEITAGQKIGIVGRTGAGKSSLLTVLFRLVEPSHGRIVIDGIDITTIGLHELRSKLSIIPQDPVLFSGTIRRNLDPFNEFTDDQLWKCLTEANLKQFVGYLPSQLDGHITESGSNLSVGQRQLLCLARALLKKNQILVIDEATANVDHETDEVIQRTLKREFISCTVLTIAHRLNTVIEMDKILVMDGGELVEFDEPYILLNKVDGYFKRMVDQSGGQLPSSLRSIAEEAYYKKHSF